MGPACFVLARDLCVLIRITLMPFSGLSEDLNREWPERGFLKISSLPSGLILYHMHINDQNTILPSVLPGLAQVQIIVRILRESTFKRVNSHAKHPDL